MSTQDSPTWTFLGFRGPLLCAACGLPFHNGERTVLVCQGAQTTPMLTLDQVADAAEFDDEGRAPLTDEKLDTTFDLVHETCP